MHFSSSLVIGLSDDVLRGWCGLLSDLRRMDSGDRRGAGGFDVCFCADIAACTLVTHNLFWSKVWLNLSSLDRSNR